MKQKALLSMLLVLALITLACGPSSLLKLGSGSQPGESLFGSGGETPAGPSGKETQDVTGGGETQAATAEPGEDAPAAPTAEPAGEEPTIAELDDLESYRSRLTIHVENKEGSESHEMVTTSEWVREPRAEHIVMESEMEGFGMEAILVGSEAWAQMGGEWFTIPPDQVGDMMFVDWHTLAPDLGGLELDGQETVNGIHCKHYVSSGEHSMTVADPEDGGTLQISSQAEIWVANQNGIPDIAVRQQLRMEGSFLALPGTEGESGDMTTTITFDVYDINEPITIEAPE